MERKKQVAELAKAPKKAYWLWLCPIIDVDLLPFVVRALGTAAAPMFFLRRPFVLFIALKKT